jgi:hypothetical protein
MYTHQIIFRLGDGGKFIMADLKIDKEGKAQYKITQSSDPLPLDVFQAFAEYLALVEKFNKAYSGVPILYVKDTAYTETSVSIKEK